MKKLQLYSLFIVSVVSFCCYGDVQSEFTSGWQKVCDGNFAQARSHYNNVISSEASSTDKSNANLRLGFVDVFEAIDNGQYAQAKTAVDTLKTQYTGNESLALYIFRTAEKMEWSSQFDLAKELYADAKSIDPAYSAKATWCEAWINVFEAIDNGQYAQAKTTIDSLKTEATNDESLGAYLFNAAKRMEWGNQLDVAKELYVYVKSLNDAYSAQAAWRELWINVFDLIEKGQFDLADNTIKDVISQFSGTEELAEMLFRAGERYQWIAKYDRALELYNQSQQAYSSGQWAQKSKFNSLHVKTLLALDSWSFDTAQDLTNSLITGFSDNPGMPEVLLSIAERYRWAGRYSKVEEIYNMVKQQYSNSKSADKADMDIAIVNTLAMIEPDNIAAAETAINNLVRDLAGDERLPDTMALIGEQYYVKGAEFESSGKFADSEVYFQKAVVLWEGIQKAFPQKQMPKGSLEWAGRSYSKTGQFEKAAKVYETQYQYYGAEGKGWHSLYMAGRSYDQILRSSSSRPEELVTKIKDIYKTILRDYPDCPVAGYAKNRIRTNLY